jgi:hypothetical protein
MALTQVPIELSSTPGIVDNSNATAITIDSSENVGIGTSSPAVPLHVHADGTGLRLQGVSPDTNGAILDFYNSSGSRRGLVGFVGSGTTMMVSNDESGPLAFQTANTERMRLTATGLGIGTTSPYASLTVDTANGILNIANGNTSGGTKIQAWGATPSDGYLAIEGYTKEYMRINSAGVGIGTSSPSQPLHVDATGGTTAALFDNNGTNGDVVRVGKNGTDILKIRAEGTADVALDANGGAFIFKEGGAEAMRIDSSGNVGIGTTSASARLHVPSSADDTRTSILASGVTGDPNFQLAAWSGTGGLGSGTEVVRVGLGYGATKNSYIHFHRGPSTTGGFMSFSTNNGTERMRIDSSGNLLLATTNAGGTFSVERNGNTYNINAVSDANNTSEGFFRGYSTGSGSDRVIIYSNGNIVNAGNSYGALSDLKLKENIVDSGSQWDDVKSVRVRKYSIKLDQVAEANQLGVIAQELEESGMAGLVYESADRDIDGNDLGTTTKQVKYSILYMKAVKALQEAMDRIETLEAKVQQLENN